MNQFVLRQGLSIELQLFPHIIELGIKKNAAIQLQSLPETVSDDIRIYYIIEGKFEWTIHQQQFILYPGDVALILPGQIFGNEKGFLEIGCISWIHIRLHALESTATKLGKWSSLSESESLTIGKMLLFSNVHLLSKFIDAGRLLQQIKNELFKQEIGYYTRVNHQIDELFINITRQLIKQNNSGRDFPKAFILLEQTLRQDLSHQWTVEEMAAVVGIGTTLFNEKVKNYSGFSPINYLINIRISEAIKLLKNQDVSITDIALDLGFYSSQHFSTTFKKLTGYTPSEIRKKNISNE
jgi:AraC-like DNA-binding protein